MMREERIEKAIRSQQLPTYEEWYKINKDIFELLHINSTPEKVYEEYVREELGE